MSKYIYSAVAFFALYIRPLFKEVKVQIMRVGTKGAKGLV